MKVESASDVFEILEAYIPSALLGLALEKGLFWKLDARAMTAREVAEDYTIPVMRCRYWLDILVNLGLLLCNQNKYSPSEIASSAILSTISQDAWHNIANESRDSYPYLVNLSLSITEPGSAIQAQGVECRNYVQKMKDDPDRAVRFTRMLLDLHRLLADNLGEVLNTKGVKRLMDLGGGSGIMSNAIVSRNPEVQSTIVDIENVCHAGEKIVSNFPTADRINYFTADFMTDELPTGFDMILECDVCIYEEALFKKLQGCLNPGGRLVIVDQFALEAGTVPHGRPLSWGFISSMEDPAYTFPTEADVKNLLTKTGFRCVSEIQLPDNFLLIDAAVFSQELLFNT
jgi:predicted TPR repeat methyltransferase